METKKVLSIDPGIKNLGYVYCEIGTSIKVLECNRVDITFMKHSKIPFCECTLRHENCIPDYLDHFVQENDIFEKADIILLERQPPQGLLNVQDLLFIKYRDKITLINPNSIHKYFKMTKGDYDLRKIESVDFANSFLNEFYNFEINERKHDISDAMLTIMYHFDTLKLKTKCKQKQLPFFEKFKHTTKHSVDTNYSIDFFDQFKYTRI